ncbi:MAG TPA: response regulator [Blastocatellia bacterium]|jgi:DNA-binding response OmpR family regulator
MATAKGWLMKEVKGRILFIDDDQDTCEMMRVLLGMEGYEAALASGVSEGLSLALAESFDLILIDWYFEDGTGIELCRMIRAFDGEIPIFFYTGVAYESELKKALKAGAQGCFVKPVDMKDLIQTVSRYSSSKES